MHHRPIHAALRERVPIALWGHSRIRTVLAALAASAAGLIPAVMVASPAQAANPSSINNLTVSDAGNWEGGQVSFTLTYTGSGPGDFTIATAASSPPTALGVASPSATDGTEDYDSDPSQTSITFPGTTAGGTNTITVTVDTVDDDDVADETFRLAVTDTNSVTKYGTGSIWAYSDNTYPTFTLKGPSAAVAETATKNASGATVQKAVTVTATLTDVLPHPVTIPVSTSAGSRGDATLNAQSTNGDFRDFDALPATAAITIPAYSYTGTINVNLWDDSVDEPATQYFNVASGATNGPQADGGTQAIEVGVADDDATPTVSVADAPAATEGDYLSFPVSLSGLSELPVTTKASTADGIVRQDSNPAVAGDDYTSQSAATVTIAPYTNSRIFSVATLSDSDFEGPENVKVSLADPTANATLGTATTAYGVINDEDAGPAITTDTSNDAGDSNPSGSSFVEGATGETVRKIDVTVVGGGPWDVPIKVDYAFKDGTAKNGIDYKGAAGSFTIPAGTTATNLQIPVTIVGDTIKEGVTPGGGVPDYETFMVDFTSSTGTITPSTSTIRITEGGDDLTPTWAVGNASVAEGDTGTATAKVPVTLSAPAATDTTFSIGLADGTATETGVNAGTTVGANDYDWPTNRTLTIPAGSTVGYIDVPVNSDTVYEQDETVVVTPTLTSNNIDNNAPAGTLHTAALTIANDDAKPSITFNNLTGNEGGLLRVNGTINGLSQYDYKVGFAVAAGATDPATPGKDFDAPANIGTTPMTVTRGTTGALTAPFPSDIYLTPDTIDESTETFTVTATETTPSPTGFTTSVGTYKITDDLADMPPAASISDETIDEDEGSVDVHVTLTQVGDTTATEQKITIPYWTADGSAKAGKDYSDTKGTLSIDPGTTAATIKVPIINDKLGEGNENFWVKLGTPTSPAGATIAKGAGEVIINANDGGSGGETPGEPGGPGGPAEPGAPTIDAPKMIVGAVAVPITGQATSGATVELWGAPMGDDSDLKFIMSTEADEDGNYSFSRWIGQGYRFATQANDLNSEEVTVTVQQKPVFVASSPSRGKLYLAVQGNPRGPAQTVIVQKLVNGKWMNTWRGTTASNNLWKVTVNQPSRSTVSLRAFVAGYTPDGLLPGYTTAHRVTIR